MHLLGIADLSPAAAHANLARVGWAPQRLAAGSLAEALKHGNTHVGDDWRALVGHPAVDVVVECTGHPIAAVDHCLAAFAHGKHVVNVTVEADAFCGPLLARRAAEARVVYSLAFGDQPALICDLVDWARTCGFPVVAAGRGHKWLPHFCRSTPDTVWGYYGLTPGQAARGAAPGARGPVVVLGRRGHRHRHRRLPAAPRDGAALQFDCWMIRPAARCIGRAFIGYSRENASICGADSVSGCCITSHSTPSLHGGVVSEPM